MQQQYEIWMVFWNSQDTPITFILEPWGEVYIMKPRARFRLHLQSSVPPSPIKAVDVKYDVGSLTVYGWEGCIASLFEEEEALN